MDEGRLIQFAELLARDLEGVSRNEWRRWTDLSEKYDWRKDGWEKGLKLARKIASDAGVRGNIMAANGRIAAAIEKNKRSLNEISGKESSIVFGYVSWMLKIEEKNQEERVERRSSDRRRSFRER
ncbi:MAG TPA: hypothetical protein PLQ38_09480 [Methanothrix sp.]|nr:hypothetical protein [Methanothrix sp.]